MESNLVETKTFCSLEIVCLNIMQEFCSLKFFMILMEYETKKIRVILMSLVKILAEIRGKTS